MLNIGVTGGIGAGKSTVARVLTALGAHLVDADVLAREVVEVGTEGLAQVAAEFGSAVLDSRGALDRTALGRVVFADPDARASLEGIIHPLVARRTAEILAQTPPGQIVVHDVPLIVENDLADRYHLVLVAGAGEQVRLKRLTSGRGLSTDDAWARIRAQADDDARRRAADVWLDTEQPRQAVRAEVEHLWQERLVPYAANIAEHRKAPRSGPAQLTNPPGTPRTWAVQAEQIMARIRRSAGDRIRTADHIGSTSVPGLIAKDVLDVQLGVQSLQDADEIADALRQAGFPRSRGIDRDTPKPDEPDPARWTKGYYASADPGRPVNLHVREVGGPGWRYALAFRDWLRADADVCEEYARVKKHIAAATSSTGEYAEAKEPWFTETWPRLQEWIEHTGWHPPQPTP